MAGLSDVLKLRLLAKGEAAGTWGDVTNANLKAVAEAISGSVTLQLNGNAVTLAALEDDAAPDPIDPDINTYPLHLRVPQGSSASDTRTVTAQNTNKFYLVSNEATDAAALVTFTVFGLTSVTIGAGETALIFVEESVGPKRVDGITAADGSFKLPTGTTDEQDASPKAGFLRFNTEISQFEGYNGTSWGSIGGGATGGSGDEVFVENGQTVTAAYTLSTNKNAMSVGPITINSGVTVTVPDGAVWLIL